MKRLPRRVLAVLAVLALLVGGEAAAWRWATHELQRGLDRQAAQWRSRGWTVRMGAPRAEGWPLHARLVVPDVALAGTFGPPGGVSWAARRVVLDVGLLHPRSLLMEADGQQELRLGAGPAIPFVARSATAHVALTPGVPPHEVDIALTELRADAPLAGLRVARATLHLAERPGAGAGEGVLSATLDAADIGLPAMQAARSWALGSQIEALSLEADVNGAVPGQPPVGDLGMRAAAWRDGGGAVAVRRLALRWGPLHLDGTATLALDGELQPMGTASVRLAGQTETLDAMVAARLVAPSAAQAAKAVLGLLARTPPGGGPPVVEVPLALQGSLLTMGRIPLLRLPRLSWPDLVWSPAP